MQCHIKDIKPTLHEYKKGKWSSLEDAKLLALVEKVGKKWTLISQNMGNRSDSQCRERYERNLNLPEMKKMEPEEIERLLKFVNSMDVIDWTIVREKFLGRPVFSLQKIYKYHKNKTEGPKQRKRIRSTE
jgi:hypothetical protein